MSGYQQIADEILPMAPPSYERVVLRAQMNDDHSALEFSYDDAGGRDRDIKPDTLRAYRISNLLGALRDEMQQEGKSRWASCTFTLFSNGKFKFDVTYPD